MDREAVVWVSALQRVERILSTDHGRDRRNRQKLGLARVGSSMDTIRDCHHRDRP